MLNVITRIPAYGISLIYIGYVIMVLIYMFIINNRLEQISGEVTKVYIGQYGGGVTGSKYNSYYIKNEDLFLKRRYSYFPSLIARIEQKRAKVGNKVWFYIDKKEVGKQFGTKRKMYVPIGLSNSLNCYKGLWFFISLLSYTVKNTIVLIVTILIYMFLGYYLYYNPILYNSIYTVIMMLYILVLFFIL